jgi:hypothetical protein
MACVISESIHLCISVREFVRAGISKAGGGLRASQVRLRRAMGQAAQGSSLRP